MTEALNNLRVGDAIALSHEFDELMSSIPASESSEYLEQALADPDLVSAFYTRDSLERMKEILLQAKELAVAHQSTDLVYSEFVRSDLPVELSPRVLENTANKELATLLAKLPVQGETALDEQEKYHQNVRVFLRTWRQNASELNPPEVPPVWQRDLRRPWRRKSSPLDTFLPTKAAVDVLAQIGIIPPNETNYGASILQGYVRKDLAPYPGEFGYVYQIIPAEKGTTKGYKLDTWVISAGLY